MPQGSILGGHSGKPQQSATVTGFSHHVLMNESHGRPAKPDWALLAEPRGITVNERAYREVAKMHHAWPSGWPESWRQTGRLWRADVFDVAASWRTGALPPRQLLTAVCAWGNGPRGYGPWRTAKALGAVDLDRRLSALDPLRSEVIGHGDLIDAYEAFMSFSRSRLPWFRVPFITKLLYFAGYRRNRENLQPLILDSVVARRLPDKVGVRIPVSRRIPQWTSAEWMQYLRWAKDEAGGGEPDGVEMRLFASS
jgi:hypothetical protein